ncbi:hypothetical protein HYD_4260 [Candidatus Hydrogenosomobacter endosymbioticus]|uniref:Uncharacterized protein n=1 Tax=Candidatus Hydrogenosomobacter endosymbioticus TaxID=2558174 RepID=A0ABM7V917_9PROT|nr:hypothetical protein HYD_4260 [Candidatus Hydrogenosomobacter endosymbioticus]
MFDRLYGDAVDRANRLKEMQLKKEAKEKALLLGKDESYLKSENNFLPKRYNAERQNQQIDKDSPEELESAQETNEAAAKIQSAGSEELVLRVIDLKKLFDKINSTGFDDYAFGVFSEGLEAMKKMTNLSKSEKLEMKLIAEFLEKQKQLREQQQ